MTPSMRGQRAGSAVLLGLVTLVTAGALIVVTTRMGQDSVHLWQAGESVRAAAGLEIALLLHSRERRLLEMTGEAEHERAMRQAEARARFWLGQARSNDMVARLERQREVQVNFLAGVAHDLRNPIQALKLATTGAGSKALPPERAQQRLAMVERQVERLGRMVDDLLDTTRIEAGQLELHLGTHDLAELVREAVELHRAVSDRHPLELQMPEQPVPLRCDATRISQVLNNLPSRAWALDWRSRGRSSWHTVARSTSRVSQDGARRST